MPKITTIEVQKRNKSRYSIFLDDSFAFGIHEDVLLRSGIKVGMEIDQNFIENVLKAEEIQKTLNSALKLLSYRVRSEQELCKRLIQKGYEENNIEIALEKLRSYQYVNDENFARMFAKDRQNLKKLGQRGLRTELRLKGISESIIQEVIDETCTEEKEFEQAVALCDKKMRSLRMSDPKSKQKLIQFLIRKGYSFEIAMRAIAQVMAS